ncbi:MAG TPA: hypothetical protein VKW09_03360 [bacterium]|nr:hypothetical protein [bacterium]
MIPSRRLSVIALLAAALAGLLQPAEAADNITVTPATVSAAEDVYAPGAGWTFDTAASWFPAGWNSAYTYHTSGCATVGITGGGGTPWSLTAYYTTNPATAVNVAVAQAGVGACGTPAGPGTPLSANSGSPTTLLTNQSGNQTTDYFVVVQPTIALTAPTTITITFTVAGKSVNSATLAMTMSPGNAFAVTLTPSATSFAEDVTTPGPGWAFTTGASWLPGGWNSAYTYYTGGCVAVQVKTSVQGWNLTAYYTTSPSTSINLAVAQAGTGGTCGTPAGSGTPVSANSGSPTTLLTAQNGTQTVNYYIVTQPAVAVTSNVTVTTTFTSQ